MGCGYSVDPVSRVNLDAMRYACQGNLAALQQLAASGAPLRLDYALTMEQSTHEPVLNVFPAGMQAIHVAAKRGHLPVVQWLLACRPDLVHALVPSDNSTAINMAAQGGFAEIVECLLNYGANPNHALTGGTTPLLIAAQKGQLRIVQLLLERGAFIDCTIQKTRLTPLMLAAYFGHAHVVEFLLRSGAASGLLDSTGKTAEQDAGNQPNCSAVNKLATQEVFRKFKAGGEQIVRVMNPAQKMEQQRLLMERGMAACNSLSFRIAKLATMQPVEGHISRDALRALLFDVLSWHPIVFFLAGADASGSAQAVASQWQMRLSDHLLPLITPFLDDPPAIIAEEVKRGAFTFMHAQEEKAKSDQLLQQQMETTERQVAAMQTAASKPAAGPGVAAAGSSGSPSTSDPADWSKRFQTASNVWNGVRKFIPI